MLIDCGCGCKKQLQNKDNRGRSRKMIHGHNVKISKPWLFLTQESIEKIRKWNLGKKYGEKTKRKHRQQMLGKNNHRWKGGRYRMKKGYICIWIPSHPNSNKDGYVLEHRLIMEKHIGRYLTLEEVVHHLNGVRDDNRIENLELFSSNVEHMREEFATRLKKV